MNSLYRNLEWLPRPPTDFHQKLRDLGRSESNAGFELQTLTQYSLDVNQLIKVSKALARLRADNRSLAPLTPFRLGVLSNSTVDFIAPALITTAARYGVALELIQPSYDQVAQEALTPDSTTNRAKPDAVLFALDYHAFPIKTSPADSEASAQTVNGVIGYLQTLRDGVKRNCNAVCIFQSIALPAETLFGSLDRSLPGTPCNLIGEINRKLSKFVQSSDDIILDVAGIAETVGLADWHNTQLWQLGRFPFSDQYIPLYADHVSRLIAAIRGKSRRVLILDLDNTVWGGVIGDDGLEGIKIAQGDAIGEAHLAVQRIALDLRSRGIVLAISSKNTDEVARMPFLHHPEMLLKLDHIAVFRANWRDKASNIQAIAEELSLGLDAMVFLDDNPVERGLVRHLIPQVAVPELPSEPAYYARTLAAAGYFEAVSFAREDASRADYYRDNAKRASLQREIGGLDAYLASLDMTITFQPFDANGRARIAQLINKSNQYNLTTRRYTESEVAALETDQTVFTLQVRLSDSFGDNGMISVVICRREDGVHWKIDTWLMSCRVLGRKVEHMVLREIVLHARGAGIRKVIGEYLPTPRNGLVIDHYEKLGFSKITSNDSGTSEWEYLIDETLPETAPMRTVSIGFPNQTHTI